MDWTPYIAPVVTALLAAGATYAAMMSQLSELKVRVEHVEKQQMDIHALSNQIAGLAAKVDDLREDVGKHNNIIERTFKLESDTKTAFHRIDELRDEVHDMKIGGTK